MTNSTKLTQSAIAVTLALILPFANAADENSDDGLEHITIISHYDKLRTEAGSATLIGEAELEKFEYNDIHRILASVPGINIREEDGYGLRPNIGFRGVTPERSKKISIMEDGVLIGPSPYSAPAAYYFPMTTRMTAVEVFKGPAAIKHGPQTVAGALNLVTRQIPEFSEGAIDLSVGADGYQKAHAHFGSVVNNVGFLLEGVTLKADGFKELDGGGDTGFVKNDLLAKFNYKFEADGIEHTLGLKLSYSDEESDETYLGLTDQDFADTPYRRYAASQPALMDTEHQQIMFSHFADGENFSVATRVYRNDYERAWKKLNGLLNSSVSLQKILHDPETYELAYGVISGKIDSVADGLPTQFLNMGTNDREYYSQGIQVDADFEQELFGFTHNIAAGVRYHEDEIERKHFEETYEMVSGIAQKAVPDIRAATQDIESTKAWSVYIEDKITLDALTLGVGVRGEFMDMHYQDQRNADLWQDKSTHIWLPSISGFYQLSEESGILFGVHEGFVPSSPKRRASEELENSINYEFGGRFNDGVTQFEVVSFFNDYQNLTETCGFSNCGIIEGETFSGGEVDVYGVEVQFSQSYPLNLHIDIPYSFVYTYTQSEFKNSFQSSFAQWGLVDAGDSLPYLADHQATFNIGFSGSGWKVNFSVKYVDEMQEVAGTGETLSGSIVPSSTTLDLSASYDFDQYGRVYAKVDNVFDNVDIVSRRPYGARPGKPRQVSVGYKYAF
ncbi:TonB-dependent receptor family protein [Pseudoalteromonas aurantia]|uniref:Fe(3+) dicitrate transport protein n=1 Tax=Pseudoalteromonas aurantia 208 TaxID=1314867 RepID=A0ABR9ECQ0_9GAMM|nr:TonB-dependent receptor [Pseudoalteromonas aurantia]MBE0368766.1 Fe(3+) dicitrate transport protein [Pseudoalteromonas aurantia 208]